jgi:cyanophycinase
MRIWTLLFCILFCLSSSAFAGSLFLFGGGPRPQLGLQHFVRLCGGSPILIVTWSTQDPEGTFQSISADLRMAGAKQIQHAPQDLSTRRNRQLFFEKLDQAGGVFFSGGNQNLALDVIDQYDLRPDLKSLFESGIPFAGTSAGTALMPKLAMRGGSNTEKPELREGLGLIPYFVDQHFIVRGREPRLRALIDEHRILGIGVDEGMLAYVKNDILTAIGPTAVELLIPEKDQKIEKLSVKNDESVRLK